ncbi:DUF2187 family protein [Mesobacillus maritimus]|jgi:uncharacterized protein YkvS|uniref:DUF2187 family protein n=1 Tax=Mesobacillus maritimus TaxID=1643336 RepID=A0ABS7K0U1_9BACI|nr:DUF2187 family protein [Mesobacillus maritimus]MBY0095868.1 DUF2187 family protein [Mesobacillus maritimus]
MGTRIAAVGDNIVSIKGIKGKVEKVKENSVIVEIIENLSEYEFINNRTVVSHKNYMVIDFVQ